MGTIFTAVVVLVIVAAAVLAIYRDKKKHNCAGSCAGCSGRYCMRH
jgi:hypothetical protein